MLIYDEIEPQLRGLWGEFLVNFGIDEPKFTAGINSKNMPCPCCGGEDRAHWRMQEGRIALYCRNCADDKMKSPEQVIMEVTGISFGELVQSASDFVNHVPVEVVKRAKKKFKKISRINMPPDHRFDVAKSEKMMSMCCLSAQGSIVYRYVKGNDNYMYFPMHDSSGDLINFVKYDVTNWEVTFIAGGISYGGFTWVKKPESTTQPVLVVRDISCAYDAIEFWGGGLAVAHSAANMKYICLFGLSGDYQMIPVIDEGCDDYLCYEMEHYIMNFEKEKFEKRERDTSYD